VLVLGPAPKRLIQSLFRGKDWIRIATEIELNYSRFDAFVILHGTDTMAYTSSALSFLLEDLGKTVV
jgi:lysophospholipase